MQHIDGPPKIQSLPEPAGACRARVEAKAVRVVTSAESLDGITDHSGSRRHLRQRVAVRPPEPKSPVGPARDLVALLVHRSVMPAAEQGEVGECGRAPVGPVAEVMPLGEAQAAPREAAALIPMVERSA